MSSMISLETNHDGQVPLQPSRPLVSLSHKTREASRHAGRDAGRCERTGAENTSVYNRGQKYVLPPGIQE